MKTLGIDDLQKILNLLVSKLKSDGYLQIEFETDLYRFIPTDKWDTFQETIVEAGSLYDDIDSLDLLLKDSNRPCTYVDFDRVASLLRAISQKNNPA